MAIVILWPFMTYIVLAEILTYALFPIYTFFYNRVHRKDLASGLSIIVTLLLMVLPAIFLVSQLVHQVSGAYSSFRLQNIERITDYLDKLTGYRFQDMLDSG